MTKYQCFIAEAQSKNRPLGSSEYEDHHIIPVCIGGCDNQSNLVPLTTEEHIVAHQLLAEENLDNRSLVTAAVLMAGRGDVKASAKARKQHLKNLAEKNKGSGNGMYGKTHTPEARKKIGAKSVDRNWVGNPNMAGDNNISRRPDVRAKINETIRTPEYRKSQSDKMKAYWKKKKENENAI